MQKCKKFRSPIWKDAQSQVKASVCFVWGSFVNGSSLINGLESKIDWF
jgi:hypothetical protein